MQKSCIQLTFSTTAAKNKETTCKSNVINFVISFFFLNGI